MPERTSPDGELAIAAKARFAGIVTDVYEPEALAAATERQRSAATNSWASPFNPTLLLTNRIIAPGIRVASYAAHHMVAQRTMGESSRAHNDLREAQRLGVRCRGSRGERELDELVLSWNPGCFAVGVDGAVCE